MRLSKNVVRRSTGIALAAATAVVAGNVATSANAAGFPGLVGYGQNVTGGAGGNVCHVTTRTDGGTGSLRACLAQSGARTIVFERGGPFLLDGALGPMIVSNGNVTIAGQSAPGQGVHLVVPDGVAGPFLVFKGTNAGNVILQHVRIRGGYHNTVNYSPLVLENIGAAGAALMNVSVAFGSDENVVAGFKNVENVTIQRSIVSFGLTRHAGGKGIFMCDNSTACGKLTVFQTLQSNHADRNPNANCTANSPMEMVSSVVSNTDVGAEVWGLQGGCKMNIVGNVFKAGPTTPTWGDALQINNTGATGLPLIYAPTAGHGDHSNQSDYPAFVDYDGGATSAQWREGGEGDVPVATLQVEPSHEAAALWGAIGGLIGAYPNTKRDTLDQRVIDCVDGNATCPRLAKPSDLPWSPPSATTADDQPGADVDRDGMLDADESRFSATVGTADHNADADGDGVTNLEEFLAWKGGQV